MCDSCWTVHTKVEYFKVIKVIDGNNIEVSPNWVMGPYTGNQVHILGYETHFSERMTRESGLKFLFKKKRSPEKELELLDFAEKLAVKRLKLLLLDHLIELKLFPTETKDCIIKDKLKCRVYLNNNDVAYYFPDYHKTEQHV